MAQLTSGLKLILTLSAFWLMLIGSGAAQKARAEIIPEADRIIAIGDLHGDYDAYIKLLKEAGLIDKKKRWIGSTTVLVQTGDIADRGPDTRKIIRHLKTLRDQAETAGGRVVTLVGNHEAMNMTGDFRYVHAGEYKAFRSSQSKAIRDATYNANQDAIQAHYRADNPDLSDRDIKKKWLEKYPPGRLEHQLAWSPDGEIGSWVISNPVIVIVGDTLFIHGGLSADYRYKSIDKLNAASRLALTEQSDHESRIINDPSGPLWYRGLIPNRKYNSQIDGGPNPEDEFERVLKNYDVKRVVVGHTPSTTGIKTHYNDRLIQIDTGISDHYGGTESFLRIEGDLLFAHDDGAVRQITGTP